MSEYRENQDSRVCMDIKRMLAMIADVIELNIDAYRSIKTTLQDDKKQIASERARVRAAERYATYGDIEEVEAEVISKKTRKG